MEGENFSLTHRQMTTRRGRIGLSRDKFPYWLSNKKWTALNHTHTNNKKRLSKLYLHTCVHIYVKIITKEKEAVNLRVGGMEEAGRRKGKGKIM